MRGESLTPPAEARLVNKAQLLTLTAPNVTVPVGRLRVLSASSAQTKHAVFRQSRAR